MARRRCWCWIIAFALGVGLLHGRGVADAGRGGTGRELLRRRTSPTWSSAPTARPIRPARRCHCGRAATEGVKTALLAVVVYLRALPSLLLRRRGCGAVLHRDSRGCSSREYFVPPPCVFIPSPTPRRCAGRTGGWFPRPAFSCRDLCRSRKFSIWRRLCSGTALMWCGYAPKRLRRRRCRRELIEARKGRVLVRPAILVPKIRRTSRAHRPTARSLIRRLTAQRALRLADVTTVEDEPMMGVTPIGRRHPLFELDLDLERILAGRSPVRLLTRKTWVSTAMVSAPNALLSTTFAVLRPTPGNASSASRT